MDGFIDEAEDEIVLGFVVEEGRGSLPYHLVHGESLVAAAAWALGAAGVTIADLVVTWDQVQQAQAAVVLHDPLCPLTPPEFIADCVQLARERASVVVGVREVTDTIKELVDDDPPLVGATTDRDKLWSLCSPIVVPAVIVAQISRPAPDFEQAYAALDGFSLIHHPAPDSARRVSDSEDIALLEALTKPE